VELFCHIWLELRTNWTAWGEWNRDKKCIGWKFHISKSIHMISCRLTQECQSISIWFVINLGVSASVRIAPRIWVEILTSAIWWPRYQNQDDRNWTPPPPPHEQTPSLKWWKESGSFIIISRSTTLRNKLHRIMTSATHGGFWRSE
jgi:hypothetical protein